MFPAGKVAAPVAAGKLAAPEAEEDLQVHEDILVDEADNPEEEAHESEDAVELEVSERDLLEVMLGDHGAVSSAAASSSHEGGPRRPARSAAYARLMAAGLLRKPPPV